MPDGSYIACLVYNLFHLLPYNNYSGITIEKDNMAEFEIEDHHEVEDISSQPEIQDLMKLVTRGEKGFVRVNPSGFVYPTSFVDYLERIKKFEVRDDDIWLCTFPKSGTTWASEMVWCLMNNLDFKTSKSVNLDRRIIYFEHKALATRSELAPDTFKILAERPSPRIIKTHLPFMMLPDQIRTREKTPRIIHVYRNSRDTCVSLFHYMRIFEGYTGDFNSLSRLFLEGLSGYYSPFWEHVKSFYHSKYDNIMFLKYEDMKKDLRSNINSVSTFLGCKSYSEDEKDQFEEHLSFKNFKNSASLNKRKFVELAKQKGSAKIDEGDDFMRKGIVGDWVNHFTDELAAKFLEKEDQLNNIN